MNTYSTFTHAYKDLIAELVNSPEYVCSPRGQKIKERLCVSFEITDPRHRRLHLKARKWNPIYSVAESLWYLSGISSTEWIARYAGFWNNISDDGVTANSAYGARIFKPHPRIAGGVSTTWTQWQYVIDELASDNDSRRAVIHIRSPQDSILAKKDVPCTLALQFFIRDEALHLVATMRSNDVILGLGNDVPAFTIFQELMALELSHKLQRPIELGRYIHVANSLHVYERHFQMCEAILNESYLIDKPDPVITTLPDIDLLLLLEKSIYDATSLSQISQIVGCTNLKEPWSDWVHLFAANSAKRLGDKKAHDDYLAKAGYMLFI